jgi:hypothetical protein
MGNIEIQLGSMTGSRGRRLPIVQAITYSAWNDPRWYRPAGEIVCKPLSQLAASALITVSSSRAGRIGQVSLPIDRCVAVRQYRRLAGGPT